MSNGIPPKLLKSTKTVCSEALKTIFNNFLIKVEFPNEFFLYIMMVLHRHIMN